MPNLSFYGQRELSTGLQLQQKVHNHTAISNCCLTRSGDSKMKKVGGGHCGAREKVGGAT